jgi:hypothetical protein
VYHDFFVVNNKVYFGEILCLYGNEFSSSNAILFWFSLSRSKVKYMSKIIVNMEGERICLDICAVEGLRRILLS